MCTYQSPTVPSLIRPVWSGQGGSVFFPFNRKKPPLYVVFLSWKAKKQSCEIALKHNTVLELSLSLSLSLLWYHPAMLKFRQSNNDLELFLEEIPLFSLQNAYDVCSTHTSFLKLADRHEFMGERRLGANFSFFFVMFYHQGDKTSSSRRIARKSKEKKPLLLLLLLQMFLGFFLHRTWPFCWPEKLQLRACASSSWHCEIVGKRRRGRKRRRKGRRRRRLGKMSSERGCTVVRSTRWRV